jgi:hypothetical protein
MQSAVWNLNKNDKPTANNTHVPTGMMKQQTGDILIADPLCNWMAHSEKKQLSCLLLSLLSMCQMQTPSPQLNLPPPLQLAFSTAIPM